MEGPPVADSHARKKKSGRCGARRSTKKLASPTRDRARRRWGGRDRRSFLVSGSKSSTRTLLFPQLPQASRRPSASRRTFVLLVARLLLTIMSRRGSAPRAAPMRNDTWTRRLLTIAAGAHSELYRRRVSDRVEAEQAAEASVSDAAINRDHLKTTVSWETGVTISNLPSRQGRLFSTSNDNMYVQEVLLIG